MTRWKTVAEDYRNRARRADYLDAYHDMFKRTDTRCAPWVVIDGNHKKAARMAALTALADTLETQADRKPLAADPAGEKLS